jgi:RNA polymerase sigma-70 factor (family 1)
LDIDTFEPSPKKYSTVMKEPAYQEKELFARIAKGDEAAFALLFNLYLPKLYPFIIKFTRSEQAALEVVQETFIRVWLNRDKLGEIENPGGWLYKVASNECHTYARKMALHAKFSWPLTTELGTAIATEDWLDLKQLNHLISEAVDKLPPQRKMIYHMSRNEGKSIPEIATALGISPNTVKNALVASLKFIREYLVKCGISLSILLCLIS